MGSALVEVLVAFTLFSVVVMATGTGTMMSTAVTSMAQQRSVASALVSSAVANATALPFNDLAAGLNPTADALSSDPAIQVSGSTCTLRLTGATLATNNTKSSEPPLVPHIATVTNGIPYKVATYPQAGPAGLVDLVVVVSWTSALHGPGKLVGEAQVAAP